MKSENYSLGYRHLTEIVNDLAGSYNAITKAIDEFISISFDRNQISTSKDFLFRAKSGYISDHIRASKYYCSRIGEVYNNYIKKTIVSSNTLSNDTKGELENLFKDLGDSDKQYIIETSKLEDFLVKSSDALYRLIESNYLEQAALMHREFIRPIESSVSKMDRKFTNLLNLRDELIEKSKQYNLT
jgi:hypothetical protein